MLNGQQVLVVDGLHEIQEVLHAVLAPRGLRVDWIRSHVEPAASGTGSRPDILVIDAEALPIGQSNRTRHWNDVPRVILGADENRTGDSGEAERTYLTKPFHFPELIQAIERLLPKQPQP